MSFIYNSQLLALQITLPVYEYINSILHFVFIVVVICGEH